MKKKYNELNKLEKKIAIRKYKKNNSTFVFPVFISLIIIGYYLYEYVSNLFILPLIIISFLIFWYDKKKTEKEFKNILVEIKKEDYIKYGYNFEIEKKEVNKDVKKRRERNKKSNNK